MNNTARKGVIVGAGFVGTGVAYSLLNQNILDEMVLIDINKDKADGEARDLFDGVSYTSGNCRVYSGDYPDCHNADIVIITAGINQKPGQTRLELVDTNAKIMKQTVKSIMDSGFNGILLVVSNPVDVLTYVAWQASGLPHNQVFGTGTALDSTRLRMQVANKLNVDPHSISAYIIGEHGDSETPLWSQATVGGKPILEMIDDNEGITRDDLDEMYVNVRDAAYYIIDRKGYTNFGIGLSTARVVKAILNDEHAILPVSAYFDGEYHLNDVYTGIPAVITENGVDHIVQLHITEQEQASLNKSVDALKTVLNTVKC